MRFPSLGLKFMILMMAGRGANSTLTACGLLPQAGNRARPKVKAGRNVVKIGIRNSPAALGKGPVAHVATGQIVNVPVCHASRFSHRHLAQPLPPVAPEVKRIS